MLKSAEQKILAANSKEKTPKEISFFHNSQYQEITEALNCLATDCDECQGKKMYFCIEERCKGNSDFCYTCDQSHTFHRTNELQMLCIERKTHGESEEQLLLKILRVMAQVKEVKVKNQWKSKPSQRAKQIERINEAIDFYEKELKQLKKKNFIAEIEISVVAALSLMRNRNDAQSVGKLRSRWTECRKQFQQAMKNVAFWHFTRYDKAQKIEKLTMLVKQNNKRLENLPDLKLLNAELEKHQSDILFQTCLGEFVCSDWNLPVDSRRSACFTVEQIKKYGCPGRLLIRTEQKYYQHSNESLPDHILCGGRLKQLTVFNRICTIPADLQALSTDITSLVNGPPFPTNLRKLYVDYERVGNYYGGPPEGDIEKLMAPLVCQKNLRELITYLHGNIHPKILRSILQFAQKHHSLIAIRIPINRPSQDYLYGVQTLKHLWVQYKAKLLQFSIMIQSKYLGSCYWTDHLIEFAENDMPVTNIPDVRHPHGFDVFARHRMANPYADDLFVD